MFCPLPTVVKMRSYHPLKKFLLLCFALLVVLSIPTMGEVKYDNNGYVMYCPCMGRFGNQVDHFLGSLSFAKKLNRTLIIPPWITHEYRSSYGNDFIPYREWFQVSVIQKYHRAIEMDDFMKNIAPTLWPIPERKVYCHRAAMERSNNGKTCPAKDGNPFGPFWNNFEIDFSISEPFPVGLSYASPKYQWDEYFPVALHPVIAFMGAPASYPVRQKDRHLQKLMEWSPKVQDLVDNFMSKSIHRPFVGVHLRNGEDWKRACEHVGDSINYPFMSSPQCVGYDRPTEPFTREMCYPGHKSIKEQVLDAVKGINAKSIFIATDANSMEQEFKKWFSEASLNIQIVRASYNSVIADLAMLIEADDFIGSCASSITAFAVRKRELHNKSSSFFGKILKSEGHSEL